jgi:hypothetical protein
MRPELARTVLEFATYGRLMSKDEVQHYAERAIARFFTEHYRDEREYTHLIDLGGEA